MAKLIIIAGIKRSGSTWMYNAVRLCLEEAGYSVHIAGDGQYYEEDCGADYQIIKSHPFHQWMADRADFVFTSDRDDEGIRASWQRFKGEELTDAKMDKWRQWFELWDRYSKYTMVYAWMRCEHERRRTVEGICKVLSVPFRDTTFASIEAIRPPTDKDYDPVTLLFSNHITGK